VNWKRNCIRRTSYWVISNRFLLILSVGGRRSRGSWRSLKCLFGSKNKTWEKTTTTKKSAKAKTTNNSASLSPTPPNGITYAGRYSGTRMSYWRIISSSMIGRRRIVLGSRHGIRRDWFSCRRGSLMNSTSPNSAPKCPPTPPPKNSPNSPPTSHPAANATSKPSPTPST